MNSKVSCTAEVSGGGLFPFRVQSSPTSLRTRTPAYKLGCCFDGNRATRARTPPNYHESSNRRRYLRARLMALSQRSIRSQSATTGLIFHRFVANFHSAQLIGGSSTVDSAITPAVCRLATICPEPRLSFPRTRFELSRDPRVRVSALSVTLANRWVSLTRSSPLHALSENY